MNDFQARLATLTQSATQLVAQLSELNRLREEVRKAQLFEPGNDCGRNVRTRTALSRGLHLETTVDLRSVSIDREPATGQA
jgi:hypothetical protein